MSDTLQRMIEQNRINDREVKRFALTILLPFKVMIISFCVFCYYIGYKEGSLAGAQYANEALKPSEIK